MRVRPMVRRSRSIGLSFLPQLRSPNSTAPAAMRAPLKSVLRKALADDPGAAPVVHALGLSLIRQKRIAEATEKLAEATKLEPGEARFAYVFAVALHDTGKLSQAIDVLKNALLRNPYDRDILIALSSYEVETGALDRATDHANLLMQLEPDDQEIRDFATAVKNLAK